MSNVAAPCTVCSIDTTHVVEIVYQGAAAASAGVDEGEVLAAQHVCRECFDKQQSGIAPWHALFDRLLLMGASRKAANAIVIKHMERARRPSVATP